MTKITVNDHAYGVEFRVITAKLSHQQRRPPGPIGSRLKAITTCVIVREGLMGVGTSLCVPEDNFDRRKGMRQSFERAAHDCTEKSWDSGGLILAMEEIWPARRQVRPAPRVKIKPTAEQIEAWRNTPEAIAKRRQREHFGN